MPFPATITTPIIPIGINWEKLTVGTASLSACADAASVVTDLFTNACLGNLEKTLPARLVRNARENILSCCVVGKEGGRREVVWRERNC
jgi:hypothetical protein